MALYRIIGGSFRLADGAVRVEGEQIELDADIAERFRHQLEMVDSQPSAEVQPEAPSADT